MSPPWARSAAFRPQNFSHSSTGTFLDNHDQARFLSVQPDTTLYKAALTYLFMSQGIPIVYYGTEQGFNGGPDPANREPLWTTKYPNNTVLYQYIAQLNTFRHEKKLWQSPQVQRYAADSFYAFSVGSVFVALTNVGSNGPQQHVTITYHPFSNGQKLCNLFWPKSDCIVVANNQFDVYLNNGEAKVCRFSFCSGFPCVTESVIRRFTILYNRIYSIRYQRSISATTADSFAFVSRTAQRCSRSSPGRAKFVTMRTITVVPSACSRDWNSLTETT